MICEFYQNTTQKSIEDRYIKANIGRCVHFEFTKAERLSRLKEGDILVVANAATLSSDPVGLLWILTNLSQKGVYIHFAEENAVIRGNACEHTSHVIENILSLLVGATNSCSCGMTPFPAAAVHGGTHGCVERDPSSCSGSRCQELNEEDLAAKTKDSRHLDAGDFSQKDLKIKFTKKD